jgi:hypothetical protein
LEQVAQTGFPSLRDLLSETGLFGRRVAVQWRVENLVRAADFRITGQPFQQFPDSLGTAAPLPAVQFLM